VIRGKKKKRAPDQKEKLRPGGRERRGIGPPPKAGSVCGKSDLLRKKKNRRQLSILGKKGGGDHHDGSAIGIGKESTTTGRKTFISFPDTWETALKTF